MIQKVCVVGGGLMGRQIGLNTAIFPFEVRITDNNSSVLENVREWEDSYLAGRIAKGRMTEEQVAGIRDRFRIVPTLKEAAADADLVIEAVVEQEPVKHALFRQLSAIARPDAILATNSSYMVSSLFCDDVSHPERLVNLHYFNPALVMKLTEVVQGEHCADATAQAVYDFSKDTGKTPIWIRKEIDGFVVNRVLGAIHREARFLVENGYCTYEEVDLACENGLGHPMGPFRLNDLTGLDLTYDIMTENYKKTGEKPPCYDLYKEMYEKGWYGKKSGQGFYSYK